MNGYQLMRMTFRATDEGVEMCEGLHQRSMDCEWRILTPTEVVEIIKAMRETLPAFAAVPHPSPTR